MKRISSFLLALVMLFSFVGSVGVAQAAGGVTVTKNGNVITVSGTGDMDNYSASNLPSWSTNNGAITEIVIEKGVTSVGDFAFSSFTNVNKLTIADTVKYIGTRAFSGCWMLKSIHIPASVETIGECAFSTTFSNLSNLAEITVDGNNKHFVVENGILYNSIKTVLYKIPSKLSLDILNVDPSVVTIREEAAISCTNLTEVHLPASVEFVGRNAFAYCTNLASVTVNNFKCDLGLGSIPNNSGLKLFGYKGSNVEFYAQNNNFKNIEFVALSSCPNGHTEVIDKAVAPTCTKAGLTQGSHCSVCGTVIKAQTTVNATGHKYDSGKVTKAATCTATGVKTYTCTVCKATKTETIAKKAHTYKNYVTKATTSQNGSVVNKCSVCGAKKSTTTVYKISSVALSTTATYYNGKVKTPGVTVKDSKGKTLKKGTDYTVSFASGRKNVGRYAVTVTFKGNYSGKKTLYFNIIPRGVSKINSVTPKSKGFVVNWTKQRTQTTGYQIQYSTNKNMSGAKTITMPKNTYYAKNIKGLKGNKRYYVRIRTYKVTKFNGKNYNIYSPWCAAKYVTTRR